MPTILLEQIIELLTGWKDSFFTWANAIGDKIASIKTNTDSLPDIKDNTDDIKDNTAAVITPISNINTNVASITSDTASIRTDTGIIKNNAVSIATSSGQAAAFAEDVANNTLEVKNKITTIASDTTQMRADSGAIRADVSEIKDTLGLYLYNTIVTEDAEGSIANFDTDLQDYLQNAVVTIPADAGGIHECKIGYGNFNQLVLDGNRTGSHNGINYSGVDGVYTVTGSTSGSVSYFDITAYLTVGHVYYYAISNNTNVKIWQLGYNLSPTLSSKMTKPIGNNKFALQVSPNISNVNETVKPIVIDLTQMFGSIIADYIYSLEQATADAGINLIKNIFSKDYYPYNAGGSIVSVESVNGSYYPNASVSFGSSITDGGSLDLTTGLLTVNTTPPTLIQLAPAPIKTLKGLNSIWADIGDISVTYRETLKHYLEKQDSNSRSLNRNANLLRENISSTEDIVDDSDRRI